MACALDDTPDALGFRSRTAIRKRDRRFRRYD
ncbi:MAG: hypothetical protein ACI9NC_003211, partial [Verrucomicrobiales bacterium]